MKVYVFQRDCNREAIYREGPEDRLAWPMIEAIHLTRDDITDAEIKAIINLLGERVNANFDEYLEFRRKVDEALESEGLKILTSRRRARELQLFQELGPVPGGPAQILEELLKEKGFKILIPQVVVYQVPLTDFDQEVNREMKEFKEKDRENIEE